MKYLKKNLEIHSLKFLSVIFIQILFPPLMLLFWGKNNFNLWLFLFAVPSVFSFFQISITAPIRNEMYRLFKKKKINDLKIIYQHSFFLVLVNIFLIALIGFLYFFINDDEIYKNNLDLILIVFLILFLNLFNSNAYSILTHQGSYTTYLKIEIFFSIFSSLIIPFSYYITSNFTDVFYIRLFLELIKTLVLFKSNKSNIKINFLLNFKIIKFKYIKKILILSLGYSFDVLSNIIKGPGIIFLVGLTNLNLVGLVSTTRTMFYYLPIRFLSILIESFYLEFNNILNDKKLKKNFFKIFKKLILFLFTVFIIHICVSLFLGKVLYEFWINNKFQFNSNLVFLIVLDSIITLLGIFLMLPFKSIHKNNKVAFIELLINLILFIIFLTYGANYEIELIFKLLLTSSLIILLIKIFYAIKLYKIFILD